MNLDEDLPPQLVDGTTQENRNQDESDTGNTDVSRVPITLVTGALHANCLLSSD